MDKKDKDTINGYKIRWGYLLYDYLKQAGNKGLTIEEIENLFPSQSKNSIVSFLYRQQIPRKPYRSKSTGKCRKVYYYPNNRGRNWKKWIKELLEKTKYGLSLTDILMETGVQKALVEQYLKTLPNLKNTKTLRYRASKAETDNIIIRYYLGCREVRIKRNEVLFSEYKREVERKKASVIVKRVKDVVHGILKVKKRITSKDVMSFFLDTKENISEYYVREILQKEGLSSIEVYNLADFKGRRVPYKVYYLNNTKPLDCCEVPRSLLPMMIKDFILKELEAMGGEGDKQSIKEGVGCRLGFELMEMMDGWGAKHVPTTVFDNALKELLEDKRIKRCREFSTNYVYYSLGEVR